VLVTVVLGMVVTLSTTSFTVLGLRTLLGKVEEETVDANAPAVVAAPAVKPFSQETVDFLLKGAVASACLSIGLDRTSPDSQWATPLRTVFMGFSTVFSFVWAARLPAGFVKVIHPLVTSTAIVLLITRATAVLTGSTFLQVLKTYKTGSLAPLATGAGDILLFLLGPAVISLAIAMYSRKALMQENLLVVIVAMLVSSVGTLFGTATFVRALNIGGAGASGNVLRLSLLPRNVTTALAMAIASIIGGDLAITASVVVLTGIIGATFGGRLLTKMGVKDPVSRGLGIGSAAQGLGVASFVNEKDAFPFAAIAMVLTAVAATTLVSIPVIRDTLIAIATGPSTISAVTDAAAASL
jgi:putative effector of murein hydrolase